MRDHASDVVRKTTVRKRHCAPALNDDDLRALVDATKACRCGHAPGYSSDNDDGVRKGGCRRHGPSIYPLGYWTYCQQGSATVVLVPLANPLTRLRMKVRGEILTMLSGDPHGEPEWVKAISMGTDAGYFGPHSAVWHVNGGIPVIVAGVRALLMQTLHPGAMAGVHDHSRYASDPIGRLSGTVRWVVTTTFGSRDTVANETARVSRLHDRVTGDYSPGNPPEKSQPYSAHDEDLIGWVHVVFTDAFLRAHREWGDEIPPDREGESGEDRYVREWAQAGRLMGMRNPPTSVAELEAALDDFRPVLRADDRVIDAISFLTKPPLPRLARIPYSLLVGGAIVTIDPQYRELLGIKKPWWPASLLTRLALGVIGRTLGTESTSRKRATERIARLATDAETY